MDNERQMKMKRRILKIIPILHSQEETMIPYKHQLRERVDRAWQVISPTIMKCYDSWEGVQVYVDGFAIPEEFKNPDQTPDGYKEKWLSHLLRLKSPMGLVLRDLVDQGAVLESTEINEKDFWTNYKDALQKAIKNPSKNVQALDELDRERERLISRRINETLGERGILLIGRKHLGKFKFDEDITTEIPSPRGFDND